MNHKKIKYLAHPTHHLTPSAYGRREKLEDSRRFQYFKRDADELETWIHEKLSTAAEESFKDTTNLQAKIQKHQAFEAEVRNKRPTLSKCLIIAVLNN